jgi:hypothetical protein
MAVAVSGAPASARTRSAAARKVNWEVEVAMRGRGFVGWIEGNYQSYIEDLKWRKGPGADQPHPVAYKKLVRA